MICVIEAGIGVAECGVGKHVMSESKVDDCIHAMTALMASSCREGRRMQDVVATYRSICL